MGLRPANRLTRAFALDPLHGVLHQLGGCLQVELVLDARPVGLDRLDRQVQPLGNLARALPPPRQFEDLQLAITEQL